jgi:hypothetical protein
MKKTLHRKYLVMVHQRYFLQVYILPFFNESDKTLDKKKREKFEKMLEKKK